MLLVDLLLLRLTVWWVLRVERNGSRFLHVNIFVRDIKVTVISPTVTLAFGWFEISYNEVNNIIVSNMDFQLVYFKDKTIENIPILCELDDGEFVSFAVFAAAFRCSAVEIAADISDDKSECENCCGESEVFGWCWCGCWRELWCSSGWNGDGCMFWLKLPFMEHCIFPLFIFIERSLINGGVIFAPSIPPQNTLQLVGLLWLWTSLKFSGFEFTKERDKKPLMLYTRLLKAKVVSYQFVAVVVIAVVVDASFGCLGIVVAAVALVVIVEIAAINLSIWSTTVKR